MSEGKLKIIKLIGNEEIIGITFDGKEYVDSNEMYDASDLLFIKDPMKLECKYSGDSDAYAIYIQQWMPASDENMFSIKKQHILTIANPGKNVTNKYYDLLISFGLDDEMQ